MLFREVKTVHLLSDTMSGSNMVHKCICARSVGYAGFWGQNSTAFHVILTIARRGSIAEYTAEPRHFVKMQPEKPDM